MELLSRYLPRIQFASYEDFKENFCVNVPEPFNFAEDIVDAWAAIDQNKTALLYCDDSGYERRFSFGEISELSQRAASYFLDLGIQPGDRVLTLLRRRWEYWVCAVALHRIGAVIVPASIQLREKDIDYRVDIAEVKMVLALNDDYVKAQIKNLQAHYPSLKEIVFIGDEPVAGFHNFHGEFEKCSTDYGTFSHQNSDEMAIYFTSGTSGMPKMAVHDRTYPLGHIITAKYMQRVQNNGLHLTQADSGWAKFGWGNIYGQWICGSAVLAYDPERFNPRDMMEVMQKYRPTSLCIPPTMYRFLLHEGLKKEYVESIQWYSTAGEPLSGEVNNAFYDITGHYIHEGYGQSEGTPITCGFEWLDIKPSSMGKPSPLYNVAIVHADGSRCEAGEEGEVVIFTNGDRPLGLLRYYGEKGAMHSPYECNVYHTGDTAYEDEDGYYKYIGRSDDMIKCSGYRIGPFEIESVLNTHPAVKESAVVGYPDEIRGQIVCAVIVLQDTYDGSDVLTKELQLYVKENTAPYKHPRLIKYVSEIPKTTSGKIIRNEAKLLV